MRFPFFIFLYIYLTTEVSLVITSDFYANSLFYVFKSDPIPYLSLSPKPLYCALCYFSFNTRSISKTSFMNVPFSFTPSLYLSVPLVLYAPWNTLNWGSFYSVISQVTWGHKLDIFLAPLRHSLAIFAIIFSLKVFGHKG